MNVKETKTAILTRGNYEKNYSWKCKLCKFKKHHSLAHHRIHLRNKHPERADE